METKTKGTILLALMNFSCLTLCGIFPLKTLLYSRGLLPVPEVSASNPANTQTSVYIHSLRYNCAIVNEDAL